MLLTLAGNVGSQHPNLSPMWLEGPAFYQSLWPDCHGCRGRPQSGPREGRCSRTPRAPGTQGPACCRERLPHPVPAAEVWASEQTCAGAAKPQASYRPRPEPSRRDGHYSIHLWLLAALLGRLLKISCGVRICLNTCCSALCVFFGFNLVQKHQSFYIPKNVSI